MKSITTSDSDTNDGVSVDGHTAGAEEERWAPEDAEALLMQLASAFVQAPAPGTQRTAPQSPSVSVEPTTPPPPPIETGILTLDAAGLIESFSEGAERIFGHAGADVIGRPFSFLCAGADQGGASAAFVESGVGSGAARDLPGRRRDGTQFAMEVSASAVRIDGKAHTVVVARDVTSRRQAEVERNQAERRYRTLIEQIPAVTFSAALLDGFNEIYIGPQIEALLGFSQKEWMDDPVLWFRQLHPEDQERWNAEFTRGCATGGPFRAECRFIARDGRTVWVHGEARVVRDEDGRPLFVQGVAFDISEIKAAEEKMQKAQDALVRTEKLSALGQLAASVGHELRNPLTAIRNAWFFVEKKLDTETLAAIDPRLPQMTALILPELNRCGKIIGELLDFARERPLYCVASPVRELVAGALAVVVPPAPGIRLLNEVDEALPVPFVDADQFRQVLVNILQNAVEAVDPRSGVVWVRAGSDGASITLAIGDNGKGMPEKVKDKIFDALFTTKLRGTGLGLSIVASIVKRHQGTITVESEVGRGTTFEIRVPIGEASSEPAPQLGGATDLRPS